MIASIDRRKALTLVGSAALLASPWARAQAFPSKPITLLVPVPPGGSLDAQARALADNVSRQLGQPVLVLNRPGGVGGTLAPASITRGAVPADGYTLSVLATALYRLPHLQKVNFDPLQDFTYILNVTSQPFALVVRADAPWNNLQDYLAHARAKPGETTYGTMGAGTTMHITMEMMAKQAGVKLNLVPFKGVNDTYLALLGGHIDSVAMTGFGPNLEAGKVKVLALLTDRRLKRWPAVPTFRELGYSAVASGGWGIGGPRGMDPKVVQVLHDAFKAALADPVFMRSIELEDQEVTYMGPAAYTEWVTKEFHREKRDIDDIGLKLN